MIGVFSKLQEFGRLSRYCQSAHLIARDDEDELRESLVRLSDKRGRPVLFATDDQYVYFLAKHGERLASHFEFAWVPLQAISAIIDKAEMAALCREAGIPSPRTHFPKREEALEDQVKDFPFPCLIKPRRSFNIAFPGGEKNAIVGSPERLMDFYRSHAELIDATIWQEIIEGEDDNIFQYTALVTRSGKIPAAVCTRKLRQYPPHFGIMSFGRTEENREVAIAARTLLQVLRYRGLASLEFKYHPKTGQYYFIEMNSRLPWYNALFSAAGVNLPLLAYRDLLQEIEAASAPIQQRNGTYWISLKEDMGSYARTRAHGERSLWRWLTSAARARSYAWLSWRDPMPFFQAAVHLIGQALKGWLRSTPRPHGPQPPETLEQVS